jgi:hypothetical protein
MRTLKLIAHWVSADLHFTYLTDWKVSGGIKTSGVVIEENVVLETEWNYSVQKVVKVRLYVAEPDVFVVADADADVVDDAVDGFDFKGVLRLEKVVVVLTLGPENVWNFVNIECILICPPVRPSNSLPPCLSTFLYADLLEYTVFLDF